MNIKFDSFIRFIWRFWAPIHPYIRNFLLYSHVVHHCGRQRYHLGYLKEGKTVRDLKKNLRRKRFWTCHITWIDNNEVLNLRRFHGFQYQYHLRIFKDGEIRGHYERTPESHPIEHMKEIGMETRREDFLHFLDGWISISKRDRSHL